MKRAKIISTVYFIAAATFLIPLAVFANKLSLKETNADEMYSITMNASTTNDWSVLSNSGYKTSYITFRNTQFCFEDSIKGAEKTLQLKANSGVVYNTEENNVDNFAITGLSSIYVSYTSNSNLTMYFGDSENPTSSTEQITIQSGQTTDISRYNSYRYIAIKTGSKYATVNEITLSYSCRVDTSTSEKILSSIGLEMLKTDYLVDDVIHPASDMKVTATYTDNTTKILQYDATGANGWYFDYILNPNAEEVSVNDPLVEGQYLFSIVYTENGVTKSYENGEINVESVTVTPQKQQVKYTYQDYSDNNFYETTAMPSIGSPKLLVVPVWLSDSSKFITSTSQKTTIRNHIEEAYFGSTDSPDMKWYSVKSYYEQNSYNKLHINGVVTDWYTSTYSSSITEDQTTSLVEEVANWYRQEVGLDEYKTFDANSDGYLDALILIYGAPNSYNNNDNLWAYCFWVQDSSLKNVSNPGPNTYFWASYDFMYENDSISGNTVDAHTYIHEMGHVLGLEDYYDYSNNGNLPAAGFSMQDYNVGSHDPFSKMALGWIDPYVIDSSMTITINSLQESGDVIVLSPNFTGSPFDEYLMLELYTPTGLNEFDCTYAYSGNYPKGPTISGIRLWHVDARMRMIVEYNDAYYYSSDYYSSFETVSSTAGFLLSMSNTTYGGGADSYAAALEEDRNFDLLALVRNKDANDAAMNKTLSAASLFQQGDTFSMSEYSSSFPNGTKLNSGLDLGFSFEILELNDTSATIRFNKL